MASWRASIISCAWLRDNGAAALVWRLAVTGSFQVQLFHCNSPPPAVNIERGIICMDVGMQQAREAMVLPFVCACVSEVSRDIRLQPWWKTLDAGGRDVVCHRWREEGGREKCWW
uniref:Uncharacterized protein n=1 Tax=Photinus pyralis TaxID=7054 RepID=A0A1Y1KTR9_PHOPY